VRKQAVVLEDQADRAVLGRDEGIRRGIIEDQVAEADGAGAECRT